MREILQGAVLTYRQEATSLLTLVAPAIVVGPVVVLVAASNLVAALPLLLLLLVLYLATYAACVRSAGFVLSNLAPEPELAALDVLRGAPDVLRAALPGGLLVAAVTGSALVLSDRGQPLLALAVGLLGAAAFLLWAARHAYDQPLILVHGAAAVEAVRTSSQLAETGLVWTMILLGALSLPLLAAGLLSWGLSAALTPAFGGAVFVLALGLWLPLAALSLTAASARLVGTTY